MSNYWLYFLKSKSYPENTFCVLLTTKIAETVKKDLELTYWEKPIIALGYTIADFQGVKKRLKPFLSKTNSNFIEMELEELKKKVEGVIITKTPVNSQLTILTFIATHCNRMEYCRAIDLYKVYKKNRGIENIGRFTHLLQSVGIKKKRTKHGILLENIIPKEPDVIEEWWTNRIKENEHKEYERPQELWDSFELYLHGNKKSKQIVPKDWFWKRLTMVIEYQRIKMGNQGTVIVFPSLKICQSLIEMAE